MANPDAIDRYTDQLASAQQAQASASELDSEGASRAFQLEKASGFSAEAIGRDPEEFDRQFKAHLGGQIVRENPYLSGFVNAHPLHAQLISGELPALDRFTRSTARIHEANLGWKDVGPALQEGLVAGLRSIYQTGQSLTTGRPSNFADAAAAAPYAWSDWNLASGAFVAKSAYKLAESSPTLATGAAGAGLGGLAGNLPGAILGAGGGAAVGSVVQTLGKSFSQELQATPNDPDGAYRRALKSTGIAGVAGFASGAAFPLGSKFINGPLRNILYQIFGIQPGIGIAAKGAENVLHDRPFSEDLANTYVESVIGSLIPVAGWEGLKYAGKKGAGPFKPGGRFNPLEGDILPPEGEPPPTSGLGGPTIIEGEAGPTDMTRRGFLRGVGSAAMAAGMPKVPGLPEINPFEEAFRANPDALLNQLTPRVQNLIEDFWFEHGAYPNNDGLTRSDPGYVDHVARFLEGHIKMWRNWLKEVDQPPRSSIAWNAGLTREEAIDYAKSKIVDAKNAINALAQGFKPERAVWQARRNAEFWEAYNEAKAQFPDGADEIHDEVQSHRADQNRDLLDNAMDESETDLKQNLPDKLHELASHVPDVPLRIPVEQILKLYAGVEPGAGDMFLGWIPNLKERIRKPFGSVTVSSNEYLAKTPKEVHKALGDFIGVDNAPSQDEAKQLKEHKALDRPEYDHEAAAKEAQEIGQSLAEQAVAIGHPSDVAEAVGKLAEVRYRVRAARLGVSPKELFAEYPVEIRKGDEGSPREDEVPLDTSGWVPEEGETLEQDQFAEGKAAITNELNKLLAAGRGNRWIQVPEGGQGIYVWWNKNSRQLDIANISFDEENRGKGAFTAYLDHMEEWARDNDARRIVIENIENQRLIPFSQKKGYTIEPAMFPGLPPNAVKDLPQSLDQPARGLYSVPIQGVQQSELESAPAATWIRLLNKIQGVKQEQLDWMQVKPWLLKQKGDVSKEALIKYMTDNDLQVHEVVHGGRPIDISAEYNALGHQQIELKKALSGLIKTKEDVDKLKAVRDRIAEIERDFPTHRVMGDSPKYNFQGGTNRRQIVLTLPNQIGPYRPDDVHFTDTGGGTAIGWARIFDIAGPNGEKLLGIDEIQSKRHQAGAKYGYETPYDPSKWTIQRKKSGTAHVVGENKNEIIFTSFNGEDHSDENLIRLAKEEYEKKKYVPDAPFKDSWHEPILKRLLIMAAEEGYDGIVMTPGKFQAERADKRIRRVNKIESIAYGHPNVGEGLNIYLNATGPDEEHVFVGGVKNGDISEIRRTLGDKLAKQILEYHTEAQAKNLAESVIDHAGNSTKVWDNLNIETGGEFYKNLYDKTAVRAVDALAKKFGSRFYESSVQGLTEKESYKGRAWSAEALFEAARQARASGNTIVADILHTIATNVQSGMDFYEQALANRGTEIAAALGGKFEQSPITVPMWRLDITPELREHALAQGFSLMQGPRGRITFNNTSAMIELFNSADKSTLAEELFHKWIVETFTDAARPEAPASVVALRDLLLKGLGKEPGSVTDPFDLSTEDHERAATAGLQYLREGKAPNEELKSVFAQFKEWLMNLYRAIVGTGHKLNDDLREFFDQIFGKDIAVEEATRQDMATLEAMRKGAGFDFNPAEFEKNVANDNENLRATVDRLYEKLNELTRTRKEAGEDITQPSPFEKQIGDQIGVATSKLMELRKQPGRTFDQPDDSGPGRIFQKGAAYGRTQKMHRKYEELILKRAQQDMEWREANAEKLAEKQNSKAWKDEANRLRPEIRAEVEARPEVKAYTTFEEGRIKIDSSALTEEQKAVTPPEFTSATGLHPDDVANFLGYGSADELIQTLAMMKGAGEGFEGSIVSRITAAELRSRLMEKFTDTAEERLDEIKAHALNETQMELLHEYMLAAATKLGMVLPISKAQVDWGARELMHGDSYKGFKSDRYLKEAGKAARWLEQALLEDNPSDAFRFAQYQYISSRMAKEAMAVEREAKAFKKVAKRFRDREVTGYDTEDSTRYVDWVHDILMRIGYPVNRSLTDLQREISSRTEKTLNEFLLARQAEGKEMYVPDFLLDPTWNKDMEDLSVLQARQVMRAVRTLARAGRDEQRLITQQNKMDLRDAITDMVTRLSSIGEATQPTNQLHRINRWTNTKLLQVETLLTRWDRNNIFGIFNQMIGRPLFEAANAESALQKQVAKEYAALEGQISKTDLRQQIPNPLFKSPKWVDDPASSWGRWDWDNAPLMTLTRKNLRAIMLNVGNPDNLERMATGYNLDQQSVMDWLNDLAAKGIVTKKDWDWVQAHGDLFARLKDMSDRMYRRISGQAPESIPIFPINTPFGTYRGWYHPVIHDPLHVQPGRKRNLDDGLFAAEYVKANTADGYTKSRTSYRGPLSLDMDMVPSRFAQEIHDISFREAVLNAAKVIYNKRFYNAVKTHYGKEYADMFEPWLKDIANGAPVNAEVHGAGVIAMDFLRQNIVATLIGFNPRTIQKHTFTAAIQSMNQVGAADFGAKFGEIMAGAMKGDFTSWNMAMEKSQELQRRHQNYMEHISGAQESQLGRANNFLPETAESWRKGIISLGSAPVAFFDRLSAVPTWLAAYEQVKTGKVDGASTEGDAIYYADNAVRRAHGSTAITNRPEAMRGGVMARMLTSFYTFFNHIWNKQYELAWKARVALGLSTDAEAKAALEKSGAGLWSGLFAYVIAIAIIEEAVTPHTNAENESWFKWGAKAITRSLGAGIPGVRDIVNSVIDNSDPNAGLLGTPGKAVLNMYRDLGRGGISMDRDHAGKTLKHANDFIGIATGLTNSEIGNLIRFGKDLESGKQRPQNAGDWYRGITKGETRQHEDRPDIIERTLRLVGGDKPYRR